METLRYLSKTRLRTKMLRIHLFSFFTIKTPWALIALAPLDLLIVKTLTRVTITCCGTIINCTHDYVDLNNSIPIVSLF